MITKIRHAQFVGSLLVCALAFIPSGFAQTAGTIRYNSNIVEFYNGSSWLSTDNGSTAVACTEPGKIVYNGTDNRCEFCNGSFWRSMSTGTTVAGAGTAGQLRYSSSMLQCHNGTDWVNTATAAAGITFVKTTTPVANSTQASHSVTFATLPTAGNLVVVNFIGWAGTIHTVYDASVTDNNGNTYLRGCKYNNDGYYSSGVWYAKNVTVNQGTFTVTITPTTSTEGFITATEYSGASTTSPLDQSKGAYNTSATALVSPSVTTTTSDQVVVAVMNQETGSDDTITTNAPWTDRGTAGSGYNPHGAFAHRIVTSTGTYAASWTVTVATPITTCAATFSSTAITNTCPGGFVNGGYCYYDGNLNESCDTVCTAKGKTCDATGTQAASASSGACTTVIKGVGRGYSSSASGSYTYGCSTTNTGGVRYHSTSGSVTCSATDASYARVCACS